MISFEKKILFGAIIYIIFIAILVIACINQEFSLVSDDYYAKEINFQSHIDKVNNGLNISGKLEFLRPSGKDYIQINFPEMQAGDAVSGNITLYRPADARQDEVIPIATNNKLQQQINISGLSSGLWIVKVDWEKSGMAFFHEFTLIK